MHPKTLNIYSLQKINRFFPTFNTHVTRNAHEPEDKVDIETGTVDAFRYNHTTNQRFRDADLLWERM